MEVRWIPIEEALPECPKWDEDRQAFYSEQVITLSQVHGQRVMYARMDDLVWPQPRLIFGEPIRTRGRTFKWGISEHDTTITHWMPLIPTPPGYEQYKIR
jgi:hypothetical protein